MFTRGYLSLGQVRGAPVRVHWTAPLGAFVFTGFQFAPGLWAGFLFLILVHELGHAALVQRFGHRVVAVRVHAFGGDCGWAGDATRAEVGVVAWGGVLAQSILWAATWAVILIFGWPTAPLLGMIAATFTATNLRMILFNLLPIPPLDGYRAWPLLPMLWEARREQREYLRARAEMLRERGRDVSRAREQGARQEAAPTAPTAPPQRAEQDRARAQAATEKELREMEEAERNPPPLPKEIQAILDRMTREGQTRRR